ncbi:cell envelope integrity protein TolA [Pseudoduganella flava]|nr:cell envelope integrity protein TolA [Pseudoduganella flava]
MATNQMSGGPTAGGPYRVPRQDNGWRAFALAVATHALLFVFLWGGINWQNTQPTAVEAEVWDLTTQQAAPPPPPAEEPEPEPRPAPPPPTPTPAPPPEKVEPPKVDPDIALKREKAKKEEEKRIAAEKEAKRKEKLEEERKLAEKKADEKKKREEEEKRVAEEKAEQQKKKEDEAKKKLAEKKAAEKKEADRLAKALRADTMQRITGAAGAGSGTAEKSTAPRLDSGYVAAITAKIKSNISYAGSQDVSGNPRAEFKITQLPTGEIISVRKIKSSGIPAYDAAVENAIAKSSPLPKKKDGTVERDINAAFNLKDLP